jgi:ABC-type transporter Mla subunit MlaD
VRDTVVVSQDVLKRRAELSSLISAAGALATDVNRFLVTNTPNLACAISIGAGLADVLRDNLATYGSGLTNGIRSLDNFIKVFSQGPWGRVSVELSSTASKGVFAPKKYGPNDRTRFPGEPGPTCSGGTR